MEQQIKEMNIISEPDIKIEDIKIEIVDWSFEWVASINFVHLLHKTRVGRFIYVRMRH